MCTLERLQLARFTNNTERAFLACLVKSSFWPYRAGDDDVELVAEKDSAFRQIEQRPPLSVHSSRSEQIACSDS